MHPRCRCTTTIDTDWMKRRARNPLTGKNEIINGNMNYNDWVNSLTDEERAALQTSRTMQKNTYSDKQQHEKYRAILGKDIPKSFDKFREIKYNDSEKWNDLKYYYRNINGRPIQYVKIDRELEKAGITGKGKAYPVENIEIKGWRTHAEKRLTERGITKEQAIDFKNKAIVMMKKYPEPYMQYNYYSDDGVIGILKENCNVSTVYSKDDYKEDTMKLLEVCKRWLK